MKANRINDYGLFGIAFENYIHTMARNESPIPLKIREYDRIKSKDIHKYDKLTFQITKSKYLLKGESEDECKEIMASQLNSIDYWHPCSRSLKTIDCVAKLKYKKKNVFGLLQITKSMKHDINAEYLETITSKLSSTMYIAVVPNKASSDQFRLNPANPYTKIPLYVAYLDDIFFAKFPIMENEMEKTKNKK
jgi:hypothetical protein